MLSWRKMITFLHTQICHHCIINTILNSFVAMITFNDNTLSTGFRHLIFAHLSLQQIY